MEAEETEVCPNCKRDIPAVNFVVHSVHCARNIGVCPSCKEAVPYADLQEHYDTLHKPQPCKQCGESVCGSDLEDHIRDSCARTVTPCRYCELELPRQELPQHEGYCGSRTEQCADCEQWVLIKYRQLHRDSNHGFIKLDDEPDPTPRAVIPKLTRPASSAAGTSNGTNVPKTEIRYFKPITKTEIDPGSSQAGSSGLSNGFGASNNSKNTGQTTNSDAVKPSVSSGSSGNCCSSRNGGCGCANPRSNVAVKKPAPKNSDPEEIAYRRALARSAEEERQRREHTYYNAKSQSSMKNGHTSQQAKRNSSASCSSSQGCGCGCANPRPKPAVKKPAPSRPRANNDPEELAYRRALARSADEERQRREQNAYNMANGLPPVLSAAEKLDKLRKLDALYCGEKPEMTFKRNNIPAQNCRRDQGVDQRLGRDLRHRSDLENLEPMSEEEFLSRVQRLQMNDGFSGIKASLKHLRRDLNEVTAPYKSINAAKNSTRNSAPPPAGSPEQVCLPCELCGRLVPANGLERHQDGCQRMIENNMRYEANADEDEDLLIPCEFCLEPLPAHLLTEHQSPSDISEQPRYSNISEQQ